VIGVTELTQSPPSRVDRATAALDLADEAIRSRNATSMRRALLELKRVRGEIRFARLVAVPDKDNTSPARLEALDKRIQADIQRLREYT
jgi:hypothetical protein